MHDSARNRDTLLLASGEFGGQILGAADQADLFEGCVSPRAANGIGQTLEAQRQFDVFAHAQTG